MKFSWQQIPSTVISELLSLNFDGVVIDTEHGCFSNETLFSCIQIIKAKNKQCFVRLTEVNKTLIRYILDAGADGLIFSTIETEEQCKQILEFSCYTPRGGRGLGLVRQNSWGEKPLISKDPILIPQIETKKGVENLEQIIKFNFDYYLIGPYDLSLSLEVPGQFNNPNFLLYIDKINAIIPEVKRAIHIPKDVNRQIKKYKNYGLKCLGMDTIAIIEYNKGIINA
jgi:2-keto-3-deoxy-L-rhamnonate aldolase RhmA